MKVQVARAGVGIMVLNADGKILLGKRHDDPEKASSQLHGEGTWTCPGGKVDFGQTLFETARRELKEETGIDAKDLNVIAITDEIVHDAHFVTIDFICKDFEGDPKVMEPDEITEWKWFSLDDLPTPLYEPVKKLMKNYKEKTIYNHNHQ